MKRGMPRERQPIAAPSEVDPKRGRRERKPSVITLKPAIRYQFKTGQRDWPKT
jgi:hypothetical protein